MNISIFVMTYNEAIMLPYMVKHYRNMFPSCKIVVFDNQSTDKTAEIAKDLGCEVIEYNTNGQVDDDKLRQLKNNCWKRETNEWACVIDTDELINVNEEDLIKEDAAGTTIFKFEAYNMVNLYDNYDIDNICYGTRCSSYDKPCLFKRSVIQEMNYVHGAHRASPIGQVKYSDKTYLLYHYTGINPENTFKRHQYTKSRLSLRNIQMGWGVQYNKEITLEEIQSTFNNARASAIKIK